MYRRLCALLCIVLALAVLAPLALSQTVISRTRIGNLPEGTAYVADGPLADSVVVLDARDVFTFPLHNAQVPARKVFDLNALPILGHPNAVAYIPGEQTFVFTEGLSPHTLFFSDAHGKSKGTLNITYLNGWEPTHVEGIAYIPPDAPIFPDHFVTAPVVINTGDTRLEIIDRTGQVVHEIIPNGLPYEGSFFGGVDFQPGGTLLCGYDNFLLELDFSGNVIRTVMLDQGWYEGVTRLPDGSVVLAGYEIGKLTYLDANLNRTPALDRSYLFAPGFNDFRGLAWNSDTNSFLIRSLYPPPTTLFENDVWSMAWKSSTATKQISLSNQFYGRYGHMVYMPDEHRLAISYRHAGPGVQPHLDIELYDNSGQLAETIHVSQFYASLGFVPMPLAYHPATHEFVLRLGNFNGSAGPARIQLVSRTGTPGNVVDLTAAGITSFGTVTFLDTRQPSGGPKLLFRTGDAMVITDLQGNLLQQFDGRATLGIFGVGSSFTTSITSGPNAGAFATFDDGELVVFKLTGKP